MIATVEDQIVQSPDEPDRLKANAERALRRLLAHFLAADDSKNAKRVDDAIEKLSEVEL